MTPPAAARLPEPPYYAVIFSSRRTEGDAGYARIADAMMEMALRQPGCLGAESARDADGFGITVSYWTDDASIRAWKAVAAHEAVQRLGLTRWYEDYDVRVARVERAYGSRTTALLASDPSRSHARTRIGS